MCESEFWREAGSVPGLPGGGSVRCSVLPNNATLKMRFPASGLRLTARVELNDFASTKFIDKNSKVDIVFAMRVFVLALDGVFDTGLATVLDAFGTANELAEMSGLAMPRFEVRIVSVKKKIATSQGLTVPVQSIGRNVPDLVVVPAIGYKMPEPLQKALAKPEVKDATAVLRQWARQGATMTAACIGTFVMAESGLLDQHHATTT